MTAPAIPNCTWKRPIGQTWENPYVVRYPSNLDDGPEHGMPLGGFGAGCIGRSHNGQFNLWHIDGGEHTFQNFGGCQFSVFEQTETGKQSYALATAAPTDGSLASWQWYPAQASGDYEALYPRSWYHYRHVLQAELSCEQFSPIVAQNYQETSYPIAVFLWTAHNPTDTPITVSIMLSWENMAGWFMNSANTPDIKQRDDGSPYYDYVPRIGQSTGNVNRLVGDESRIAITMGQGQIPDKPGEGDGEWAIGTIFNALDEVTYNTRWNPAGDGADLWRSFSQDGTLDNTDDETPAATLERIGGAIAVKFTLRPGKTRQIPLILAWDFPITTFAEGIDYLRRYTDFFGRSGQNAWPMIRTALKQYPRWREKIETWQAPVLEREDLPDWFKMALFNELYILTQGGSLWTAASELDPVGQFGILECLDYRWYESLDVRLYGSFSLVMLWPKLEKAVVTAFARAIPKEDNRLRTIGYYATIGEDHPAVLRKIKGATPHDLGAPNEHVWERTNYTSYQDCNLWKDLGADFVLQVDRAYKLTGEKPDREFLAECWPAVVETLHYLKTFDHNGDGIPENSGAPDQTFDDWKLQGISAYCGGLWIAALESAIGMGKVLDQETTIFEDWLAQSRSVYHNTLWNGSYYNIDSASGSDVVMADQLCGQFYARLLKLPDVVADAAMQTALSTVYDACFVKFNQYLASGGVSASDGRISEGDRVLGKSKLPIGAANGVKPNGEPENPNATHPLEVWTGINYGLAAFLWQSGKTKEAMEIAEAIVHQVYDNGLQFRTPEAVTANATFRAGHYLRAMAIWAIYGVMLDFK
jgi:non-lysosomal glucosylceramidase